MENLLEQKYCKVKHKENISSGVVTKILFFTSHEIENFGMAF